MADVRPSQHVLITGLAPDPVRGAAKIVGPDERSWAVWIPGPRFDDGHDSGFFCWCPPSAVTPLDLPDHPWDGGPCQHCVGGGPVKHPRYCLNCDCRLPSRWRWWHDACKACLEVMGRR